MFIITVQQIKNKVCDNKPKTLRKFGLHPFPHHHHDGQEYLTSNLKEMTDAY